jgi:anti-sigma factor RsiW
MLVGGRLDYLDNRRVAALMYKRREHRINLFIWPAENEQNRGVQEVTIQGDHLFHWTQSGMTYWAVSDLNSKELGEFAELIRQKTAP